MATILTHDIFLDTLSKGVQELLRGDKDAAEKTFHEVASPPLETYKRGNIPYELQTKVFLQDQFVCRHCGRFVLFPPVLRLLSTLYPEDIPYHPNWKYTECHKAFWLYTATCDHIKPVARGGKNDADNLATLCYKCQLLKQGYTLDELGWKLSDAAEQGWDGLAGEFAALCTFSCAGKDSYYQTWLKALKAVRP